jgi:hypothetical protein
MGIDPVEQFIDHAQRTYPTVQFHRGSIDDLTNLAAPPWPGSSRGTPLST